MTAAVVAVVSALVLAWAVVSSALARHNITGPLLFTAVGYLLSNPGWGPLAVNIDASSVHVVAEITLALILFGDAARVNPRDLGHDWTLPGRLLGIGLPLSVLVGSFLAGGLVTGVPWALAGFVGASLAPTDAALSVAVITDERIPTRIRRALNVESGLNDGIATPIVAFMLLIAASQIGVTSEPPSYEAGAAARELATGIALGVVSGVAGGLLISLGARRKWIADGGVRLASMAVAVGAFSSALAVHANGFIAAFVAGIAFAGALNPTVTDIERARELPELSGELLALVVWFLFGATLLPIAFHHVDVRTVGYALLSLTVVRMVPVALSLVRSGLDAPSVAFVGWFGPRGLASVVFAVLAVEDLGEGSAVSRAVAVIAFTVVLSVVLHGITAGPGGRGYLRREDADTGPEPRARPRRLLRDDTS